MKALGAVVFILLLSILLSLSMDILLGFKLSHALFHLLNPFWVIETGEYVMLAFLLLLTIGQQIALILRNKRNKQNGSS
ncbi:hypothetical protein J2S09_003674 [Bacillus fengqiuensis]|nr:hypothetical protein [Bacillus fengqiuensis]